MMRFILLSFLMELTTLLHAQVTIYDHSAAKLLMDHSVLTLELNKKVLGNSYPHWTFNDSTITYTLYADPDHRYKLVESTDPNMAAVDRSYYDNGLLKEQFEYKKMLVMDTLMVGNSIRSVTGRWLDLRNGRYVSYYSTGQQKISGTYLLHQQKSLRHGKWYVYDMEDQLIKIIHYDLGKKISPVEKVP